MCGQIIFMSRANECLQRTEAMNLVDMINLSAFGCMMMMMMMQVMSLNNDSE
jgi:hypothetical protein